MLIAIEGPDGAGKSTLIENLKKSLNGNVLYLRRTGRFENEKDIRHFLSWVYTLTDLGFFKHIIMDRHPAISEYIYGRVFRDGGLFKDWSLKDLREYIRSCSIIYCDVPLSTIQKTVWKEEQMKGVHGKIDEIYQLYSDVMSALAPRFTYDFEVVPEFVELDRIIEKLNHD